MKRVFIVALLAMSQLLPPQSKAEEPLNTLYMGKAIVTGTGERNRQPGFRDCLENVILRVSGDQRLLKRREMQTILARAGTFVRSFSYKDRLAGKPIHDEQGTYDRPHDLTCFYDAEVIDHLLNDLGSEPWLTPRPRLIVLLDVERDGQSYRLSDDLLRDQDMRSSFNNAAGPLAMQVAFPNGTNDPASGGALTLQGKLVWSDAELGWVAAWQLRFESRLHQWEVRGVNYDAAFRVAVRGAAQILSDESIASK